MDWSVNGIKKKIAIIQEKSLDSYSIPNTQTNTRKISFNGQNKIAKNQQLTILEKSWNDEDLSKSEGHQTKSWTIKNIQLINKT